MAELPLSAFNNTARSEWVRLRTLIRLRWMAISGQVMAVFAAVYLLDIKLNPGLCILVIGASVVFNLVATFVMPENKRLSERETLLTLLFDLMQLVLLLFLTGGLNNPFSLLILAPVTISATALTPRVSLFLSATAIVLISGLAYFYVPLYSNTGELLTLPPIFLMGTWVSLVIAVLFLGSYARRVIHETFSMSQALTATQLALAREQQLTTLGGVVAAAAHELGTPLATIKLASAELADELAGNPELLEDARLIHSQADRCHEILRDMGASGKDDLHLKHAPLTTVVREAAEPHENRGKLLKFLINGTEDTEQAHDVPMVPRHPEIIHGLRNLIQNAVDFADRTVWINCIWTDTSVRILVGDDGPGYPAELFGKIGDPFLSKRGKPIPGSMPRSEYQGMGLGLFIAKILLERSGAELTFANATHETYASSGHGTDVPDATGAIVNVRWARSALVKRPEEVRGALGRNPTL
jgi:two-component system, sensor histidine kinase RegB